MIVTIKNDGEEEFTLPDGTVLAAGEEIQAPAEKNEATLEAIFGADAEDGEENTNDEPAEAEEKEAEEADEKEEKAVEEEQAEEAEGEEAEADEDEKEAEAVAEETEPFAAEKEALAAERRKLAEERAEMNFEKLCEEGRLVPAQKESYMALASSGAEATFAEGKSKPVAELLNEFIKSAPEHSLYKEEGKDGEGESEPELTSEEKEVAEMFGVKEDDLIKHNNKEA